LYALALTYIAHGVYTAFGKKNAYSDDDEGSHTRPVGLAYQSPANSTFLSEQTSHQQPSQNKPAPVISHQSNEQEDIRTMGLVHLYNMGFVRWARSILLYGPSFLVLCFFIGTLLLNGERQYLLHRHHFKRILEKSL
jgi:hypothetical protein